MAPADPRRPGAPLRPHDDDKRSQHAAFLGAVEGKAGLHEEIVGWFLTLPLWLDLPGLRVAHACGHPRFVDHLASRLEGARLTEELMPEAVTPPGDEADDDRRGLTLYDAVKAVAKGLEVTLPGGLTQDGGDGCRRHGMRVRWWDAEATTYRTAAVSPAGDGLLLPDEPIPEHLRLALPGDEAQLFGHYSLHGDPRPLGPRAACVDYGAGKGGKLVAYRWDGHVALDGARFAWPGREKGTMKDVGRAGGSR